MAMRRTRRVLGLLTAAVLSGGTVAAPAPAAAVVPDTVHTDFDGDGYADLAVGVTGHDVDGVADAGAVQVLYGSAQGTSARDQLFAPGEGLSREAGMADDARLGFAIATGDFDADGLDDLAVGAPWDTVAGQETPGSVRVLYGSTAGLAAKHLERFVGSVDAEGFGDRWYGQALAAGDFDADGDDDLAVGAGVLDVSETACGKVEILSGSPTEGLSTRRQLDRTVLCHADGSTRLGSALAAGDFDGNGADDLAVGDPRQTVAGKRRAGVAIVVDGAPGLGVTAVDPMRIVQSDVGEEPHSGDRFATTLATGDLDNDGMDDLVVGAPFENRSRFARDVGSVSLVFGSPVGLDRFRSLSELGRGTDERFGSAIAVGRFDGDADDDLVVGAPGDHDDCCDAGGKVRVYTDEIGTRLPFGREWTQQTRGVPGRNETGDEFGAALVVDDVNADGRADIAIGVPGETIERRRADAGKVVVVTDPGDLTNDVPLTATAWDRDTPSVAAFARADDRFGDALNGSMSLFR
ncbi:MAG: integrin alpha [Actinomycetota bacterium]|nr:integrin alpha [Actinomycetota bacterium]